MPEEDLHATEANHAEEVLDVDFESNSSIQAVD
jgi:hypothetical protein